MKGLVIKNTGSWYTVKVDDGPVVECKIKGNFRLKGIRSTNPVAVGDRVSIAVDKKNEERGVRNEDGSVVDSVYWITEIDDRRNYIIRKSINLSKQSHILAANVDQAMLVVTVSKPETSTTFIDRFLASAEAYRVPAFLVFNKTDLLNNDEMRYQQMLIDLYETVGYECFAISSVAGTRGRGDEGVKIDTPAVLLPLLHDRITLLSGNSGVGKSTIINSLVPDANLRTSDISDAHQTGMHTTTFSEMIAIDDARRGYIIDTPGIKGFGTFDMEREEIGGYFKEIFHFSKDCRFSNCTHTHEPGCAVLKALENNYIAQSRYNSYLSMLEDKDESKYREAY